MNKHGDALLRRLAKGSRKILVKGNTITVNLKKEIHPKYDYAMSDM